MVIYVGVEYKAGEQFCNAAKAEYDYELGRISTLDNKVSMTLAFCSVILLFLLNYLDLQSIWETSEQFSCSQCILRFLSTVSQICCLIFFGVAVVRLFRILKPKVYCRLDPYYILNETLPEWEKEQAYMYLGVKYAEFTAFNTSVNEKRSKEYSISIKWLLLSILCCISNEAIKLNFF